MTDEERKDKDRQRRRKYYAENPGKAREATRKWQAENKEKIREYAQSRYAENPEKAREATRKWRAENPGASARYRAENPEKVREANRNWKAANQEKIKEGSKMYYAENRDKETARLLKWRDENPERIREVTRYKYRITPGLKALARDRMRWYRKDPVLRARINERQRERYKRQDVKDSRSVYVKTFGGSHFGRAVKRGNHAERFKRVAIFERDGWKCAYCKKKVTINTAVLEHKIPIAKGGSHTPENCTTSCAKCNAEKATKLVNGMQITIFDKVKP